MNDRDLYPSFGQSIRLVLLAAVLQVVVVGTAALLTRSPVLEVQGAVAGAAASVAFILYVGFRRTHARFAEVFPLRAVGGAVLAGVALVIVGLVPVLTEADNLRRFLVPGVSRTDELARELLRNSPWTFALVAIVLAPMTEELFFRGLVLRGLLSRYTVQKAVVLSALLFAVAHLDPWNLLGTFAMGLLGGWWVVRTGSLVPGIVGHSLNNGLAVLVAVWAGPAVPGLTTVPQRVVQFQPWWVVLTGAMMTGAGLWLLSRAFSHANAHRPRRGGWEAPIV